MNAVERAIRALSDEAAWHDAQRAQCLADDCPRVAATHGERAAALRDAAVALARIGEVRPGERPDGEC